MKLKRHCRRVSELFCFVFLTALLTFACGQKIANNGKLNKISEPNNKQEESQDKSKEKNKEKEKEAEKEKKPEEKEKDKDKEKDKEQPKDKEREVVEADYSVEHWKENLEDDDYTKMQDATDRLKGKVGEETKAVSKDYAGFDPKTIVQEKIKADGSTCVKVYYKMNRVSLILNLKGGATSTALEDVQGAFTAKKILKGKPTREVSVQEPTKEGMLFYGWKPALPKTFSAQDELKEYEAVWSDNIRVYIKGDERLHIKKDYLDFAPSEAVKWRDVMVRVEAEVALKPEWQGGDYELYDWKIANYDGEKLADDTPLTQGIVAYARTNYTKWKWDSSTQTPLKKEKLIGYEGAKPRGRLIIHKSVKYFSRFRQGMTQADPWNPLFDCDEITGLDVTECENLVTLEAAGCNIERIDLSKCPRLMRCVLNDTKITEIDVMNNADLTGLFLKNTNISRLVLPECRQLGTLDLTGTKVSELDTSKCTKLYGLYLGKTQIESLNVSGFPNLHTINLSGSKIKNLDVRNCRKLAQLFLEETPIEELDLEGVRDTLRVLYLFNSQIKRLDISQCKSLQLVLMENTPVDLLDASGCVKLIIILAENCRNLQRVNLEGCSAFTKMGVVDSGDANVKYLPFPGCVEARVSLASTVTEVLQGAFGHDESTWCKQVIVPNDAIGNMVRNAGYPSERIVKRP